MTNRLGIWYVCASCGSELLVSMAGSGTLHCDGREMRRREAGASVLGRAHDAGDPRGWRFRCERCGTEVLCTTAGTGTAHCCGMPMARKLIPALPAVG